MRALESERPVTSLDRPVGHDEDASDLGDFVAVATDAPADEVVDREFLAMLFELARTRLDDRAWYVLRRRYGLDDGNAVTLDAIGRELGLSRESVRKIERRALEALRRELIGAA